MTYHYTGHHVNSVLTNDTLKSPPPLLGKGEATYGIIHKFLGGKGMEESTFLLSKLLGGGGGGGKFQFIFELLVLASSLRHCIFVW